MHCTPYIIYVEWTRTCYVDGFIDATQCDVIECFVHLCREVTHGIPVFTADGERVGQSTKAAQKAISLVVVSRVIMATPGMC